MISLSKHTWKSIGLSSCKVKSSGVVVFSRINLSYLPRQSPLTAFDPSCLQHTPWEDKRQSMYDVAIKVKQAGAAGWGGGGGGGGGSKYIHNNDSHIVCSGYVCWVKKKKGSFNDCLQVQENKCQCNRAKPLTNRNWLGWLSTIKGQNHMKNIAVWQFF